MSAEHTDDPLNDAAESFLARLRNGETPSISEYAVRHPELADDIRDLFPTLAMVERVGERASDDNGAGVADGPPKQLQRQHISGSK